MQIGVADYSLASKSLQNNKNNNDLFIDYSNNKQFYGGNIFYK